MICSADGAIDRETNRLSAFNVYETIMVAKAENVQNAQKVVGIPAVMRIVTTWLRDESDSPETKFEYNLTLEMPGLAEILAATGEFFFSTLFHRMYTTDLQIPAFPTTGVLTIRGKIRPVGSSDWAAQQNILLMVQEFKLESSPPATPKT
jgi:hypothetical protein